MYEPVYRTKCALAFRKKMSICFRFNLSASTGIHERGEGSMMRRTKCHLVYPCSQAPFAHLSFQYKQEDVFIHVLLLIEPILTALFRLSVFLRTA